MKTEITQAELLPITGVLGLVGRKCRQSIYDLMDRDPTFPRPVQVPGSYRAWRRSEVMDWIGRLPRAAGKQEGSQ